MYTSLAFWMCIVGIRSSPEFTVRVDLGVTLGSKTGYARQVISLLMYPLQNIHVIVTICMAPHPVTKVCT